MNATAKKLQMVKADERVEPSGSSNSHYHSVQDKFANVTKKDGTIDRIKVMTTLEQQQKLQNQVCTIFNSNFIRCVIICLL